MGIGLSSVSYGCAWQCLDIAVASCDSTTSSLKCRSGLLDGGSCFLHVGHELGIIKNAFHNVDAWCAQTKTCHNS